MNHHEHQSNEPEYLVTTYRDGQFTEERLSRAEVMALDPNDVDLHWNDVTGDIAIHKEDGTALRFMGDLPGIGAEHRKMLLGTLLWKPGEFFSPGDLFPSMKKYNGYLRRRLATRTRRFRQAFGETANKPFYFLTRRAPYGLAFSADRSWRLIERLAQAENDGAVKPV